MNKQPKPDSIDLTLGALADLLESRRPSAGGDPQSSYVAKLLSKGQDSILKKVGEESTELVMASKDGQPGQVVAEMADLWFHCLVLLTHHGLRPEAVLQELARRQGQSGLVEKASRERTKGD
jgi:phosphoribosyl-ATP pyrophosphohydrolase